MVDQEKGAVAGAQETYRHIHQESIAPDRKSKGQTELEKLFTEVIAQRKSKDGAQQTLEIRHNVPLGLPENQALFERVWQATQVGAAPPSASEPAPASGEVPSPASSDATPPDETGDHVVDDTTPASGDGELCASPEVGDKDHDTDDHLTVVPRTATVDAPADTARPEALPRAAPRDNARTHEAVRLQLLGGGFDPIPVNGKAPKLYRWPTLTGSTPGDIIRWTRERQDETNTGVVTKRTPAFDIDILEQAAADAVERLVRDRYADCGVLLTRFGLAPKRAIPFRTDTPFKKITATLLAPDGKGHKLEFLADGQQFIADGIHPDTGKPYTWFGGELASVKREDLPPIDEAAAHQLVDDAIELLVAEHGYTLEEKAQPRAEGPPPRSEEAGTAEDVGPREWAYAEAALRGRADELAAMAPNSGRNNAALRAATRLGTMVAAGWIDARTVEDELAAAAEAKGESKHNVRRTIRNGFGYGAQYPAPSLDEAVAAAEAAVAAANRADDEFRETMFGGEADAKPKTAEAGTRSSASGSGEAGQQRNEDKDFGAARRLIKTSEEFVASLKAPDYLIKGVLQRRFIYSMTAPTGAGKTCIAMRIAAHVAFGVPLLGRPVKQGGVLFLAGENPDDVKMRWIKLAEEMAVDVNTSRICWLDARVPLSKKELRQRIAAEVAALGEVTLVIVDTSAAYFEGNDENDNVQAGNHARAMRGLVDLPGGPTVLVTCHPVKNPDLENLVPRGGGAFVNEVDGNLVCPSKGGGIVEVHWHVKFRGPDFAPIPFRIAAGQSEKLKTLRRREDLDGHSRAGNGG